jgi:hypothetical protein
MKTSSSIGLAAAKAATSSIDSSRGATMRVTPRRAATAAAAGADSVIWVEAWSASAGHTARAIAATAGSCTISASTPAAAAARTTRSTAVSSGSKMSVFMVR